jgi:SAM-dependent methyltransferase
MSAPDRERWDQRYRERGRSTTEPSQFLTSLKNTLPRHGRALDFGGGAGRHGIWLARRGLDVTVADISEVGLGLAREDAARAGVTIATVEADLETTMPEGPWQLIVDFHFLVREQIGAMCRALAPGGMLVFCHPTVINLERHEHPSRRFLLDERELSDLIEGVDIVSYEEDWSAAGRHEARLVARRPAARTE